MEKLTQLETLGFYEDQYSGYITLNGEELYVEAEHKEHYDAPQYASTDRGEHCLDCGGYYNILTNITKLENHFTEESIEITEDLSEFLLSNLKIEQNEH